MSEVETRLAEIRERAQHGWPSAVHIAIDARWLLDQLARVRTDTIERCAESVAATCGCHDYLDGCRYCADSVAAVRGVSHEH